MLSKIEDDIPQTLFEIARRRSNAPEPGEADLAESIPPQPPTSPWAHNLVPDEPLIDRTEDR